MRCLVLSNNREFRPAEGPVAATSRDHTLTVDPSIHRSIDQSSVRIAVKQEDPDRLLLAVQKPAIEANSATVESEVTVSWRTGPSATTSSYTVSCFSGDQWTCATYPDAGQGFTASGELEKAALPSTVDETFTFAGAVEGDVVQCFIEVEGEFGYAAKCIGLETAFVGTKPAGAPTTVVPDSTASGEISFTWTDGTAGIPEETYTIKCTDDVSVTDCLSTNGTVQETGIARGAQAGTLTGLTDGDEYKCWVIAVNSVDSVCSAPVQYTLPLAPGAPTNVVPDSTASGEISFTWTDGTAGIPEETYTIKCTDDVSVTDCLSTNGTVQETGIARGAQAGTLTGLTDGDEYKCWVIAVNSVDSVCSAPVQYTLPVRGYFSGALCASTPRLESHLTMIGHLCSCFTSPTTASPCSAQRPPWGTLASSTASPTPSAIGLLWMRWLLPLPRTKLSSPGRARRV